MGIDNTALELILLSQRYVKHKSDDEMNVLTLGRQQIHIPKHYINHFLNKYKLNSLINKFNVYDYSETLFTNLLNGRNNVVVDSIDNSDYEGASIIHNMNAPYQTHKKYQYIYDGGTIEHIFNIPQVIENVINMLDVDGLFVSVTCNNNFSGHGMYQFSPEFFLSSLNEKYGMKIEGIYIGKVNTEFEEWIDVNHYNGGRNCSKFDGNDPVYILTIARKISNERKSLIRDSPHQYSYEKCDWK